VNTLNFSLHPLDPQVLGEIKFQLFIQKQVPITLNFAKHYQLKVPVADWVDLMKKQVKTQGYPSEWFNYQLSDHQLVISSTNPLAFQLEPITLTYEIYKPPVPPKQEPEKPDSKDQVKPKEKEKGKELEKPKTDGKPKEKDKVQEPEKPKSDGKSKDKEQPKVPEKPKPEVKDKPVSEVKKPEPKTPEVVEKVNSGATVRGFNPKYLYFLFIPFGVLVLYLIIFFWKKHKHKKGKC